MLKQGSARCVRIAVQVCNDDGHARSCLICKHAFIHAYMLRVWVTGTMALVHIQSYEILN